MTDPKDLSTWPEDADKSPCARAIAAWVCCIFGGAFAAWLCMGCPL